MLKKTIWTKGNYVFFFMWFPNGLLLDKKQNQRTILAKQEAAYQ